MPELNFVLPHWLYWSGLIVFPLFAWWMVRRARAIPDTEKNGPVSLLVAYGLLLVGGFVGAHRLYVKSYWALAFVATFIAILFVNIETREARDLVSEANGAYSMAESKIARAEKKIVKQEQRLKSRDTERNRKRLAESQQRLQDGQQQLKQAQQQQQSAGKQSGFWKNIARALGGLMLALMLVDLLLLPRLVAKRNAYEKENPEPDFVCPAMEQESNADDEKRFFNSTVGRINGFVGEFAAYWSVIAVFVYYYEVIARYVFNSPTNWAHESMFLMFGMQYLLAGGYALREGAHVRVDVIYTNLSTGAKAILDVITSVVFFIFVITLLVTGWIFFRDALNIGEVSFTEWGIQYYPIKFALPLGAFLLLLQGVAQLLNDIDKLRHPPDDSGAAPAPANAGIEEVRHGA